MKRALSIFDKNNGKVILETGTTRMVDDWGAGNSTLVFADTHPNATVITVDINELAIKICKEITKDYPNVEHAISDSLKFLDEYEGQIDLLYLDSYDYPLGELLDIYGGREDINKSLEILKGMTEKEIVDKHGDIIHASQEHQLEEMKRALPKLKKGTPILLDDNDLPGGGKTRLTKLYLREIGAKCVLDKYQSLWVL
jgi:hypothetical protein